MKGRKPKPDALKKLEGNPGRRPMVRNTPQLEPGMPECPDWLEDDAREEWGRQAPLLLKAGILTESDRAALTAYCIAWGRVKETEQDIQDKGLTEKSDGGVQFARAMVKIQDRAMNQMRAYATELGLTPSSRTRLHVPDPNQGDLFGEFLAGEEGLIQPHARLQ